MKDNATIKNGSAAKSLDQDIFDKKVAKFELAFIELQKEHGIAVLPMIDITPLGIRPIIKYADAKDLEKMNSRMGINS